MRISNPTQIQIQIQAPMHPCQLTRHLPRYQQHTPAPYPPITTEDPT